MIKGDFDYVTDFAVRIDQSIETCVIRNWEIPYMYKNNKKKNLKIYFWDSYRFLTGKGYTDISLRWFQSVLCFSAQGVCWKCCPASDFKPDIIHCNDLAYRSHVTLLLKEKYRFNDFYKNMATLFHDSQSWVPGLLFPVMS